MKIKDMESYKSPIIEDIGFDISGNKIKKGDIVEVNINGIKTKCRVMISKDIVTNTHTVELKRL